VDGVYWFGKIRKYGICEPAPGGKEGNPDVVFEIDNYLFVLEITTFKGIRAQWSSSEASSVPDHIAKYKKLYPQKIVIGIFTAPSIHKQLEQNLRLNAKKENVGMIFIPCENFSNILSFATRSKFKKYLIGSARKQLNS